MLISWKYILYDLRYWENLRLVFILTNLVGITWLASDSYNDEYSNLDIINMLFTFVYLLEAIVTIIAAGLYQIKNSYLRIGWNYVDVFIILIGLLSLIPPIRKSSVMKILNMLRALKVSYTTATMRRLMAPWVQALKKMINVFAMLIFILLVYAAACIGEFNGNRYFRCRTTASPVDGIWEINESVSRLCDAYGSGSYDCPAGTYCGNPDDYDLELTHEDQFGSELVFYGAVGFESILKSFLACFQVITYDDWAKIMYRMQDSNDLILSQILFPSLIFIGSFFCLNLIVAVVVDTFQSGRAEFADKANDPYTFDGEIIDFNEKENTNSIENPEPIEDEIQEKDSAKNNSNDVNTNRDEIEEKKSHCDKRDEIELDIKENKEGQSQEEEKQKVKGEEEEGKKEGNEGNEGKDRKSVV